MFPTITRSSALNWCHCKLDCCCIDKSLIKSLLRREESHSEDRVLREVGGVGGFLLVMVATTKQ